MGEGRKGERGVRLVRGFGLLLDSRSRFLVSGYRSFWMRMRRKHGERRRRSMLLGPVKFGQYDYDMLYMTYISRRYWDAYCV